MVLPSSFLHWYYQWTVVNQGLPYSESLQYMLMQSWNYKFFCIQLIRTNRSVCKNNAYSCAYLWQNISSVIPLSRRHTGFIQWMGIYESAKTNINEWYGFRWSIFDLFRRWSIILECNVSSLVEVVGSESE